jgi:hypothetical protein
MFGPLVQRADAIRLELLSFLQRLGQLPNVQGAHLEIDRYWWESLFLRGYYGPWCPMLGMPLVEQFSKGWTDNVFEEWKPPNWNDHCRNFGFKEGHSPIRIRLSLWPDATISPDPARFFENYPLIWEQRPEVLAASFSDAVGPLISEGRVSRLLPWFGRKGFSVGCANPRTAGTLGGLLANGSTELLMSCAHVFGEIGNDVFTPGPFEHRNSSRIGHVVHSALPSQVFSSKNECSEHGPRGAGALDLSVAMLDSSLPAERGAQFRTRKQSGESTHYLLSGLYVSWVRRAALA